MCLGQKFVVINWTVCHSVFTARRYA